MTVPPREAIPPDATMLAGSMMHQQSLTKTPVIECYLYDLPDETLLVEWQYLEYREDGWTVTRQQVAECDGLLMVLERLAAFPVATWDAGARMLPLYEAVVHMLLEDYFLSQH